MHIERNIVFWIAALVIFGLQLWLWAKSGEQIFTGASPSNPPTTSFGFLLRRRIEPQTVFVSVLHPHRRESLVREVEFLEHGGLVVHVSGRSDRWTADQLQLTEAPS